MKIFFIYPEIISQKNAREISVLNTVNELKKITNTVLLTQEMNLTLSELNDKFSLDLFSKDFIFLSKKFLLFTSTKFFNLRLLKIIQAKENEKAIFYTRHLKIAEFLLENKEKNQKIVFESHESFYLGSKKKNLYNQENFIYSKADAIVFHNNSTKANIQNLYDINDKKTFISPNGTKDIEISHNKHVNFNNISYFGTFLLWKGLNTLIDFLALNKDMKLFLYGNDKSKSANELKDYIEKKDIKNQVYFMGYLEQKNVLNEIAENQNLLIISNDNSVYSNFSIPLKIYEYLIGKNLIIAPNYPPIQEIIKDKENGFLYEGGNIESLNETINLIKNMDNAKIEKILENAYLTGKNFSWKNRALRLKAFLETL